MPPYRSGRRRSKRTISVVPVRPWIAGSEDSHPAHTLDVESRRFPHIIVAVGKGEPDFVENSWVGLNVEISETLLLVTNPCDRCVMTTLPQADLPQDHGILRTAAQHNQPFVPAPGEAMPSVGVYANVLRPGTVCRGDPVRVQQAVAAA